VKGGDMDHYTHAMEGSVILGVDTGTPIVRSRFCRESGGVPGQVLYPIGEGSSEEKDKCLSDSSDDERLPVPRPRRAFSQCAATGATKIRTPNRRASATLTGPKNVVQYRFSNFATIPPSTRCHMSHVKSTSVSPMASLNATSVSIMRKDSLVVGTPIRKTSSSLSNITKASSNLSRTSGVKSLLMTRCKSDDSVFYVDAEVEKFAVLHALKKSDFAQTNKQTSDSSLQVPSPLPLTRSATSDLARRSAQLEL